MLEGIPDNIQMVSRHEKSCYYFSECGLNKYGATSHTWPLLASMLSRAWHTLNIEYCSKWIWRSKPCTHAPQSSPVISGEAINLVLSVYHQILYTCMPHSLYLVIVFSGKKENAAVSIMIKKTTVKHMQNDNSLKSAMNTWQNPY